MTALDAVGMTAVGVARVRAMESARPDALFHDALAGVFVPDWAARRTDLDSLDDADRQRLVRMYLWIVARTVFLDGLCMDATAAGTTQVVILGAGLDARAFRLPLGESTVVYELDRRQLFDFKETAIAHSGIAPRAQRRVVVADLGDDWPGALRATGFDPGQPTLWLAEGLLVYLGADLVSDVLGAITRLSAPGSTIGATVRGGGGSVGSDAGGALADVRALWRDTGDVGRRLAELGWQTTLTSARDVLVGRGRLSDGTAPTDPSLMTATLG